jgi:hypothetical protein
VEWFCRLMEYQSQWFTGAPHTEKNSDFIGMRKRKGMQKNPHWVWLILNLKSFCIDPY